MGSLQRSSIRTRARTGVQRRLQTRAVQKPCLDEAHIEVCDLAGAVTRERVAGGIVRIIRRVIEGVEIAAP
jgi:hypothetical protein